MALFMKNNKLRMISIRGELIAFSEKIVNVNVTGYARFYRFFAQTYLACNNVFDKIIMKRFF